MSIQSQINSDKQQISMSKREKDRIDTNGHKRESNCISKNVHQQNDNDTNFYYYIFKFSSPIYHLNFLCISLNYPVIRDATSQYYKRSVSSQSLMLFSSGSDEGGCMALNDWQHVASPILTMLHSIVNKQGIPRNGQKRGSYIAINKVSLGG